ncbi:HNH endonuclease [Natrinema caseinilyticum]|uniref:HNH endonuclease n=1 Tax=Natrinema caseinilyticum TaxID=2961570 RepID=UPI0020C3CE10|nr:HNH endonuclease [Natrinema caseinilyticum]
MVQVPDFNLNNPKNYFGYTVAVDITASEPNVKVDSLMKDKNEEGKKITSDITGARNGARHLGLVRANTKADEITNLGERVISVGTTEYSSKPSALDALRSLFGTSKLFVEALPTWKGVTQEVMLNQSGISQLVGLMQKVHTEREDNALTLPILVQEIYHLDPDFARQCFITPDERDRLQRLNWKPPGSDSTPDSLWERSLYRSSVVHQFKSMLCHAGILTTKGKTRANLEFSASSKKFMWALTPTFREQTIMTWGEPLTDEQPDLEEQTRDVQSSKQTKTSISRIIRSTSIMKTLKEEYDYQCQVCGDRRQRSDDEYYAEGHHLHPLGEDGPDIRENILILCPNCHVDFDYGMMTVDPKTLTVTHSYDDAIDSSKLTTQETHTISQSYLEYHHQNIVK